MSIKDWFRRKQKIKLRLSRMLEEGKIKYRLATQEDIQEDTNFRTESLRTFTKVLARRYPKSDNIIVTYIGQGIARIPREQFQVIREGYFANTGKDLPVSEDVERESELELSLR